MLMGRVKKGIIRLLKYTGAWIPQPRAHEIRFRRGRLNQPEAKTCLRLLRGVDRRRFRQGGKGSTIRFASQRVGMVEREKFHLDAGENLDGSRQRLLIDRDRLGNGAALRRRAVAMSGAGLHLRAAGRYGARTRSRKGRNRGPRHEEQGERLPVHYLTLAANMPLTSWPRG
jgi:hypothetical protein